MMLVALLVDALFGWPDRLFERIGHPVTWIGGLIDWLDRKMNRFGDSAVGLFAGAFTVLVVTIAVALPAAMLQRLLPEGWAGIVFGGILAWPLVAARSLHEHVAAVAGPLAAGDLARSRKAVAMIVGRDPERLDEAGVARAGLESLAENCSDGVIAPLFWGLIGGVPGIAIYKAVNTMDSMIGHRTPRHETFGKVAARLDDVMNLVPARLTGVLFAIASWDCCAALRVMWRDARHHRSPNAGWPEAAMAGALGVRLSGPRIYGDRVAHEPWLNGSAPNPTARDFGQGLSLYRRVVMLAGALLLLCALF
ncbi:adenosylcobinamide-phosphate synthase CbiB [Paracoccus sp. MBLB3053]|uniref:Cobalamin biosynthesis protein CobD n=1 Tax=Paracoccus aurantius TaxID=3073814 RepID=A0ABU2HT65_9RHOB|nr:adenosylcobinamide-phosphate synthase CbiB [Paracoccus sp. MBLB3053]MDS9468233.1 adenosylcobinamide-phosphate synthase CbiB [Paracoccus sp. MBLB3053]